MTTPGDQPLAPGDLVAGCYRIQAPLARGGFGAVFRALHTQMDREVALKVLLPELVGSPEGLARFRREAELAKLLEHPNTVRLLDFGVAEGGMPYIAWELLRGCSLEVTLAEGPLPVARVARIGAQVLKALMEAHGKGIVHRDIKPANVFLCEFAGERDFVKVLDFGIAKLWTADKAAPPNLTRQGEAVGTASYMAPEQVIGRPATPVSDLYALGLTLAEALTGQRVFPGNDLFAIVRRQASREPVLLSDEVLASPLGPVLVRATRKPLEERYISASAMLDELAAVSRTLGSRTSNTGRSPAPPAAAPAPAERRPSVPQPPPTELAAPAPVLAPGPVPLELPARVAPPPRPSRPRGPAAMLRAALFIAAGGLLGGGAAWLAVRAAQGRLLGPTAIERITIASIQKVVIAEGWQVASTSSQKADTSDASTVTFRKGSRAGLVWVLRFDRETDAALTEAGLRKSSPDDSVVRDGATILMVRLEGDLPTQRRIAAALVR